MTGAPNLQGSGSSDIIGFRATGPSRRLDLVVVSLPNPAGRHRGLVDGNISVVDGAVDGFGVFHRPIDHPRSRNLGHQDLLVISFPSIKTSQA